MSTLFPRLLSLVLVLELCGKNGQFRSSTGSPHWYVIAEDMKSKFLGVSIDPNRGHDFPQSYPSFPYNYALLTS